MKLVAQQAEQVETQIKDVREVKAKKNKSKLSAAPLSSALNPKP